MRQFLLALSMLTAAGILVLVVGFADVMRGVSDIDRDGRRYADSAVLAMTSHWDAQQAIERASPLLKATVGPPTLTAMFAQFATLGPLVQAQGCMGRTEMTKNLSGASAISAEYECPATFQNGEAHIVLALVKLGGKWMLNGVHVNADALPAEQAGQKI